MPASVSADVLERHALDLPAGRQHRLFDVVDARRVARGLVGPGAAVGVGDRLECRLVLPDPRQGDALEQLVVLVVVALLAGVLPGRRRLSSVRAARPAQRR